MNEDELLITKDDLDNLIVIDETQLKNDIKIILDYVIHKGKFAMSIKEQKAHNRLRDYIRDGDVE